MVRGNGCSHARRRGQHKTRRLAGGDVLHDQPQFRIFLQQRNQHPIDEHLLTIKDIDIRKRHLAVHQQGHATLRHRTERVVAFFKSSHAGLRVGRGTGRIIFNGMHHTAGSGAANFITRCIVSEVQRHQGFENHPLGQRRQYAFAISQRHLRSGHRRLQIGHHNRARKALRGMRQYRPHMITVTQVQMPVIGAGHGNTAHRLRFLLLRCLCRLTGGS